MLEHSFIIALIVLSIWYALQEGEIFGRVSQWLGVVTPSILHSPLFECNVCMSPWYGSLLYILIYGVNIQWPIVVLCAMGINAAINKLSPDKDYTLSDRVGEIEKKLDEHGIYK